MGGFGSWLFFDFKITTRFVSGVSLVIGSIFVYGSSLEQLTGWKTAAAKALGLSKGYEAVPSSDAAEAQAQAQADPEAPPASTPVQMKTFPSTPPASKGL